MKQGMTNGNFQEHWTDENENPSGGVSFGRGYTISWQNGPLGRDDERKEPNGAFVEDIILAAIGRIECYQDSKFQCDFNQDALVHLRKAHEALQDRAEEREKRQVEGTYAE